MRKAVTIVELIVVISIILILAIVAVAVLPRPTPEPEAASRLQGWLSEAKVRSTQDRVPTGLRVLKGTPYFIQQPDDWTRGVVNISTTAPAPAPSGVVYQAVALAPASMVTIQGDFSGADILPGDYFEKGTGGNTSDLFPIQTVNPATITGNLMPGSDPAFWNSIGETQWRVVRQPRMQIGSTPLPWPSNVSLSDEEALFSPGGWVVGRTDPVRFIVGNRLVVQVTPMTGMIAIHPLAPGSDPFAFCRDGRSSGY